MEAWTFVFLVNCREFVNADEIAKGLSPFQPETVAFEAGRIMLKRIRELMAQGVDFAFETTLSTRSYLPLLSIAKEKGYTITLFFLRLKDPALAKERVRERVSKGGHSIPTDVIERRYTRGLRNFFNFIKVTDNWILADNSEPVVRLIVEDINDVDY